MKKLLTIICCGLACIGTAKAQAPTYSVVSSELMSINKVFATSRYLAFDIDISYKSDSDKVTIETDEVKGNYVLNVNNIYYNMSGTEFVQTDSFAYTIYGSEHSVIMTKNFLPSNSNVFPLQALVDSMLASYVDYTITMDSVLVDSGIYNKRITCSKPYLPNEYVNRQYENSFSITYDGATYLPFSLDFSYWEKQDGETDFDTLSNMIDTPANYIVKKTMKMLFSNYSAYLDPSIFSDDSYVQYNRQRKIYELAGRYKDFQLITSGFDNEDQEAQYYREVPYP